MRLSIGWQRSLLLGAVAWAALFTLCSLDAEAQERVYTSDDTLAAIDGAPWPVPCIVTLETGHTYDPYSLGALGEQGVAQLLPSWRGGGQWVPFFEWGYTPLPPELRDPFSPYQAVWFMEWYGARYGYGAWSTARYC